MSARIASDGKVTQLDRGVEPDEVITADDVQDAPKLARYLARALKQIADLGRRFNPRHLDFEDVSIGSAGAAVSLEHGFKGRVRWWVVDWDTAASTAPYLRKSTSTTDTTLVLLSYVAGTATLRIEAAE